MKKLVNSLSAALVVLALGGGVISLAPVSYASGADDGVVTSARSFPKVDAVRKDVFAESVSTDVDEDSHWGGIENLDVPQTQSSAERDAQAAREREATEQAAASRSAARESLAQPPANYTVTPPNGQSVSSLLDYAAQFVGRVPYSWGGTTPAGWDCSGFVGYVYAGVGVALPRTSGQMATVGQPVASLADAQPGDIIANGTHAGIYVGNGMVVNSQYGGTKYDAVPVVFTSAYSIRRVL